MAMSEIKPGARLSIDETASDGKTSVQKKGGTAADEQDMIRMGKRQELRRAFKKFTSIVGFVTILQATWESTLLATYPGLFNGGTGGVIWCTIAVWLCMLCMIASLAEMSSMAPTAGGQYHWVSEFAPRSLQKPLSYVVGWCCCLGWIAGIPSCGLQLAGVLLGLIQLTTPNANLGGAWQATLVVFVFVIATVGFNIFFARHLPLAEGLILFIHIFAFFAFLLTLWIMADHVPAEQVFFTFTDGGGWGNTGLSCLVGLTTPIWCFIGPDAGAHMSEELKDASIQLPKAMMWATFGNGICGIAMLITFCFCLTDMSIVVGDDASQYPIVQVLYNATNSYAGTCVLGSVLLVLLYFSTVTTIASASRQVWAFSRDQGFPLSSWIRYVRPDWEIPVNALLICLAVSLVLSAVNFGSTTALNDITSVSNAALIFSYIVSIACVRLKRLRGEPLLPRRWSLGRYGGVINDISLAWLLVGFFFSFWPESPWTGGPGYAATFNWSIVILATTCLVALVYYMSGGGPRYIAPVSLVKEE